MPATAAALLQLDAWWTEIVATAGVPGDVGEELRVCLHELLGNVIMHGGPGASAISVTAAPGASGMTLTVSDDGIAFNLADAPLHAAPVSLETAPIGGLGLLLVRRFTDAISYERRDGCNRVGLSRAYVPSGTVHRHTSLPGCGDRLSD